MRVSAIALMGAEVARTFRLEVYWCLLFPHPQHSQLGLRPQHLQPFPERWLETLQEI